MAQLSCDVNAAEVDLEINRYGTPVITLNGPIEAGDAREFTRKMKEAIAIPKVDFLIVALDSPGGNVEEAIKISQIVRSTLAHTQTARTIISASKWQHRIAPSRLGDPLEPRVFADPDEPLPELSKCWSACTVILFSGVTRDARSNLDWRYDDEIRYPTIGVHRPKFDAHTFGRLPPDDAQRAYKLMIDEMTAALSEMGAPDKFIQRTMSTSSAEIDLIPDEEMETLYSTVEPFYEDWLIARCGSLKDVLDKREHELYELYLVFFSKTLPALSRKAIITGQDEPNEEVALVQEFGLSTVIEMEKISQKASTYLKYVNFCEEVTVRTVRQAWAQQN